MLSLGTWAECLALLNLKNTAIYTEIVFALCAVHQNACWLGREMRDCIYSPSSESFLELACLSNSLFLILPTCLPWPTSLPVCFSLFKAGSCLFNDWDAVQSGRPISFIHLPIKIQPKFSVISIWRNTWNFLGKKKFGWSLFLRCFSFLSLVPLLCPMKDVNS